MHFLTYSCHQMPWWWRLPVGWPGWNGWFFSTGLREWLTLCLWLENLKHRFISISQTCNTSITQCTSKWKTFLIDFSILASGKKIFQWPFMIKILLGLVLSNSPDCGLGWKFPASLLTELWDGLSAPLPALQSWKADELLWLLFI